MTSTTMASAGGRGVGRVEVFVAVAVTALVVAMHLRFVADAGPLWRDEVSTVEVSNTPTLGGWYRALRYDSLPLGSDAAVRAWTALGPGRSDQGLRAAGLLVGLGTVAVLWRNARRSFGAPTPMASLALYGLCPMAVCFGDSIRGYGPGVLAGLVAFGAMFDFARAPAGRPARAAGVWAAVAALVSVHVLFFDAAWLLATGTAAAVVCLADGRRCRAIAVLALCAGCAATLSVYVPMIRDRAALAAQLVYPTSVSQVMGMLRVALTRSPLATAEPGDWVWAGTLLATAVVAGVTVARGGRHGSPPAATDVIACQRAAALYGLVALAVGVVAQVAFLRALSGLMPAFYFLPLLGMAAGTVDGMLAAVPRGTAGRLTVTAVAAVVATAQLPDAARMAGMRMSTVDLAAAEVARSARPGDLIVVTPFYLGTAVARYYHGPGELVTVPPMTDLRYQQLDRLAKAMDDPHAIDPVLAKIAAVARAHGRVWVVRTDGGVLFGRDGEPLPSRPATSHGWEHTDWWNRQVGRAIRDGFGMDHVRIWAVGPGLDVNPYERVQVVQAGG